MSARLRLPHLSIATKLYAIFALLATVTVALAIVAVFNARRHAALTHEFDSAFTGAMNVERVNALIYAVVMAWHLHVVGRSDGQGLCRRSARVQ